LSTDSGFPQIERQAGFVPLLAPLDGVADSYLSDVALVKRALECWNIDEEFRAAWQEAPARALADRSIPLPVEAVASVFVPAEADRLLHEVFQGRDVPEEPMPLRRYCAYLREKLRWRRDHRSANRPDHPQMAAWWDRQVARLASQLGSAKADAIVHTPVAFELSKGCSVGCWFCALDAEPLDARILPGTDDNRRFWRSVLETTRDLVGEAASNSFCYWATEPLDNPDYELFLDDFYDVLGRFPQTTTALPVKDVERTRRLIRTSELLGAPINRFSILSRGVARRVHDAFTPRELIRTELLPQNRGSNPRFRKAKAGRAFSSPQAAQRSSVLTENPTTIACVSGFLINLWERSVQLITPCPVSAAWPKGYRVLATAAFDSVAELRTKLEGQIASYMPRFPELDAPVRLRPDIQVAHAAGDRLAFRSSHQHFCAQGQPHVDQLAAMLVEGTHSSASIAELREQAAGVPCEDTLSLIHTLFERGALEEAHSLEAAVPERAAVVTTRTGA